MHDAISRAEELLSPFLVIRISTASTRDLGSIPNWRTRAD